MTKVRQWSVFTVLIIIGLLAGGWFLLISPKRTQADELRVNAAARLDEASRLRTQVAMLEAQARELPRQQARLAAIAAKLPDNPALPSLIVSLRRVADDAGVRIVSLTPAPPAAVAGTVPTAAVPAVPGVAPQPGAVAAPAPAAASAGQLLQVPIALQVAGGFFAMEQFIANLESLPRSMIIDGLSVSPDSGAVTSGTTGTTTTSTEMGLSATLNARVFMAVAGTTATTPGAVAGAPTTTAPGATAPVGTTVQSPAAAGTTPSSLPN